jgi:hypothetical protein
MSEDHTLKSFTVKEQQIQGMSGRQWFQVGEEVLDKKIE